MKTAINIAHIPFAEIIESTLVGFTAQSWQWNVFPSFGSLIVIETKNRRIFGIVAQIQTGSMDPARSPFPYQKTEEELVAEQPQIFEFLKTTFYCPIVGYQEKEALFYLLAPNPPQIHAFVAEATPELSRQFFARDQYLHLLFGAMNQGCNIDDLLLATLKYQASLGLLESKRLQEVLNHFSLLTGNDYRRLKLLVNRIEQNIVR